MQLRWLEQQFKYDGTQLRSLFGYLGYGLLGDSVVAWAGPCDIPPEHMVDGEDLNNDAKICGDLMVHMIIERFDCDLLFGVSMQRILASLAIDVLQELSPQSELSSKLYREGDDIFCDYKKISISVATKSPVSTLVHFAVNCVNTGTPVDTMCLQDFQVDIQMFAKHLMQNFIHEMQSIKDATHKVKWVK